MPEEITTNIEPKPLFIRRHVETTQTAPGENIGCEIKKRTLETSYSIPGLLPVIALLFEGIEKLSKK